MHCSLCGKDVSSLKDHLPLCANLCLTPHQPQMLLPQHRQLTYRFGTFSQDFVTAGLYFTGHEDILACCWCNHHMGHWESGDDPVERHLNEYPHCKFLLNLCVDISVCHHCNKMVPKTIRLPGSQIKEHRERCLETAIATLSIPGTFPRNVEMLKPERRLKSFQKWLLKDRVQDLVNNGFYSTGQGNSVACCFCHVMMNNGLTFDTLSDLHASECHFSRRSCCKKHKDMTQESKRLETFRDWKACCSVDLKELTKQGFFYAPLKELLECAVSKACSSNPATLKEPGSMASNALSTPVEKCPEYRDILEQNRHAIFCAICRTHEREVYFESCGHWMCCKSCGDRVVQCPACYQPISKRVHIHILGKV